MRFPEHFGWSTNITQHVETPSTITRTLPKLLKISNDFWRLPKTTRSSPRYTIALARDKPLHYMLGFVRFEYFYNVVNQCWTLSIQFLFNWRHSENLLGLGQSFLPYAGRTRGPSRYKIALKWPMRSSIFTFFHCKVNSFDILSHDIDCDTFVNTLVNNTGIKNQEWTVLLNNFPSSVFNTIIKDFTFINWSCRVYSVTIGCYPSECWLWKTTSVTCECHVFFSASFSWWINVVDWRWG